MALRPGAASGDLGLLGMPWGVPESKIGKPGAEVRAVWSVWWAFGQGFLLIVDDLRRRKYEDRPRSTSPAP